jgi:hypothetical protein
VFAKILCTYYVSGLPRPLLEEVYGLAMGMAMAIKDGCDEDTSKELSSQILSKILAPEQLEAYGANHQESPTPDDEGYRAIVVRTKPEALTEDFDSHGFPIFEVAPGVPRIDMNDKLQFVIRKSDGM